MRGARIQTSGSVAAAGLLLDASPAGAVLVDPDSNPAGPPRGLYLDVDAPDGAPIGAYAAQILLDVGRPWGGGKARRSFTLTRAGAWLACAGWDTVRVEVVELRPGTRIRYAWTTEQPPSSERLLLVETIAAGVLPVPDGAVAAAAAVADAGWIWRTQIDAGPVLDVPQPMPGAGAVVVVEGAAYVATVPNVIAWQLRPL